MNHSWERIIDFQRRLRIHPQTFYRKLDAWYSPISRPPELRRGTGKTNRFIRSNPAFDTFCRKQSIA